jgi:hypothetical protein
MTDIELTDPKYKDAAYQIAKETPALKDPTTPPIHWRLEGGKDGIPLVLRVLLADGRTIRRPLHLVGAGRCPAQSAPIKAPALMALPVHVDSTLPPANLKPDGKRKPATHRSSPKGDKSGSP